MKIEREAMVIQSARPQDARQLAAWRNDGAVMAHAVFSKERGWAVGEMVFRFPEPGAAEVGIKICEPGFQNRGFGPRLLARPAGPSAGRGGTGTVPCRLADAERGAAEKCMSAQAGQEPAARKKKARGWRGMGREDGNKNAWAAFACESRPGMIFIRTVYEVKPSRSSSSGAAAGSSSGGWGAGVSGSEAALTAFFT